VVLAVYAAKSFIGLRNSIVDGFIHGTSLLYKQGPRRRRLRRPADQPAPAADWRSVLEVGFEEPGHQAGDRRRAPGPSGPAAPPRPDADATPKRKLSLLRVLVALAVLAGAGYGGYVTVQHRVVTAATVTRQTWFAPYADVTSLQFSKVLGGLGGSAAATSAAGNVQPAVANTNPADAPYPQWSATADYPSGYKVVEDGEIYQSKWYNTGDDPQAQVQYSWQSAWELLGPVLPGDRTPATAKPAAGTYPAWSISTEYHAGDRILYSGLAYQAKWNNQGIAPQSGTAASSDSPWESLAAVPGEPTPSASATP
jgi:chitodextrinase